MHVLLLSHYFPPEVNAPASRGFEHCRQWVEDGEQVTVITCVPNHPAGRIYPGYRNRLHQSEVLSGIEVRRVLTYVTANEGFLKRSFNYVFFMLAATIASLFVRRPDVVVTTSPQFFNGLAGYFVSRLRRVPWILEVRDLWPESILELGAITNPTLIRLLHGLAHFAYRKADRIVVVTDAFKECIARLGIDADKITVIKNGADLALFEPDAQSGPVPGAEALAGRFVVSYVGTHGMAHGLETVLEAARLLRHRTDIGFLLIGDGAAKRELRALHQSLGLENVTMLDQLDRRHMPAVWNATDASLVVLRDRPVFATVIPSKIFESMAMRKPIILGVVGESQQIVTQAGAGICVKPEDPAALAAAIEALCADRRLALQLGQSGFDYVTRNHNRVTLARRFASLMRQTIAAATAAGEPHAVRTE